MAGFFLAMLLGFLKIEMSEKLCFSEHFSFCFAKTKRFK